MTEVLRSLETRLSAFDLARSKLARGSRSLGPATHARFDLQRAQAATPRWRSDPGRVIRQGLWPSHAHRKAAFPATPTSPSVCMAIMRSSSVGMTHTEGVLSPAEILSAPL